MKNKSINITLGIFFLLFNAPSIYSQTVYDIDDPFCLKQDIYDCFCDLINEADVIIEATNIAREYNGIFMVDSYKVEKIFKGDVSDTIKITTNIIELYTKYNNHVRKSYPTANIVEPDSTKINDHQPKIASSIITLKQDSSDLLTMLSMVQPTYDKSHYSRQLVYKILGKQTLAFEQAKDVYDFILEHEGTYFRDITFKEFKIRTIVSEEE